MNVEHEPSQQPPDATTKPASKETSRTSAVAAASGARRALPSCTLATSGLPSRPPDALDGALRRAVARRVERANRRRPGELAPAPERMGGPTIARAESDDGAVGEPGLGESLIPIWGSGRESVNHFQHGNYVRGTLWGALAITDVFLVKALVVGAAKLVVRAGAVAAAREAGQVGARVAPELASQAPKLLAMGKSGAVIVNKLLPHEAAFAREIVAHRGGTFVGALQRSAPGIDGFLDAVPVALKETQGGLSAVLRHASVAEAQAKAAGYKGVELFIKAANVAEKPLLDFALHGPLTRIPGQGVISAINILTKDGWVRIIH